jgi:hypothetical protein
MGKIQTDTLPNILILNKELQSQVRNFLAILQAKLAVKKIGINIRDGLIN